MSIMAEVNSMMAENQINDLITDSLDKERLLHKDDENSSNFESEDNVTNSSLDEMDEKSVLMNILQPEQYLSNKEMVDSIRAGESAIDLIGIVESISQNSETVRVEKHNKSYTVFNFVLQCKDGIKLPVAMWDEEIKRLKPCVLVDHIIHIDAPFAKPQKPSKFTNGRDFILTCRSNTIINNLGKITIDEKSDVKVFDNIEECIEAFIKNTDDNFGLNVYIKTEFRAESEKSNRMIGAVTDLKTKLIVYINQCDKQFHFKKGTYVQIIGIIIEKDNKFYFEINSLNQIKELDGSNKISEKQLASVVVTPKRCYINKENEDINTKKMKTNA